MTVTPPDYTAWWDVEATVESVLAQLRLLSTDVDVDRIRDLVPFAGSAINNWLDRDAPLGPPVPYVVQWALEQSVIVAYQRARTGQGNPDDYTLAAITTQLSSADVLGNVRAQLGAYKRRWGVG